MKLLLGLFKIAKEVLRHLLRRPVAGICIVAKTTDEKIFIGKSCGFSSILISFIEIDNAISMKKYHF